MELKLQDSSLLILKLWFIYLGIYMHVWGKCGAVDRLVKWYVNTSQKEKIFS